MSNKSTYPNIETLQPQYCIAGKMMRCNRLVSQIFRKYLLPFNITTSQLTILFIAAKKGTITQTFLSEVLYLEKSTVSRNMRRLLEQNYLVKATKKEINITTKGKKLLEQIIPEWEKAMTEIRTSLKQEGEEALNLVLGNLANNFK